MAAQITQRDETEGDVVPRSVGRVLDLLEIVLAEGTCTLTTAANIAALTPTTARRHLRALEARGYVERDGNGQFSAGPTLLRIAAGLRDDGPLQGLVKTVQPYLDQLAIDTGESAYLAVSDGIVATYVATAESSKAIRHVGWVGQHVPLEQTAVGRALRDPGACHIKTGAVEADITAISHALPPFGKLGVAVSVVGPAHRLGTKERKHVEAVLVATIERLARDLGTNPKAVAS